MTRGIGDFVAETAEPTIHGAPVIQPSGLAQDVQRVQRIVLRQHMVLKVIVRSCRSFLGLLPFGHSLLGLPDFLLPHRVSEFWPSESWPLL